MPAILSVFYLAGAAVFLLISYLFETRGYGMIFGNSFAGLLPYGLSIAAVLAFGLNLAKGLFCAALAFAGPEDRGSTRGMVWSLRVLVVTNSLILSLLVFSGNLVAPQADAMLVQARNAVRQDFQSREMQMQVQLDASVARVNGQLQARLGDLRDYYDPRIKTAESERRAQMDIGGSAWKGSKFDEFDRQIAALNAEWSTARKLARDEADTQVAALSTGHQQKLDALRHASVNAQGALSLKDLRQRDEAQNPDLLRLADLLAGTLNIPGLSPLFMGVILTAVAALLIEFTPLVLLSAGFNALNRAMRVPATRPHAQGNVSYLTAAE